MARRRCVDYHNEHTSRGASTLQGDTANEGCMSHVMDTQLLISSMSLLVFPWMQLVKVGGPTAMWESGNDREVTVG